MHTHAHAQTHTFVPQRDFKKPGARWPQAIAPGFKTVFVHCMFILTYLSIKT